MEYSEGDKVSVCIDKVQENGCLCSFLPLTSKQFGFIPKHLIRGLYDENGDFTISVGDSIDVVIKKIVKKGIILSDEATYKREQRKKLYYQELVDFFASKVQYGEHFEAEVVAVKKTKIYIKLFIGVHGIVQKEDILCNQECQLKELLFKGKEIKVEYIARENGHFLFRLKSLDKKL